MSTSESSGVSVTLSSLTCRYGPMIAVNGVSMNIKPGEFVTFLGPSGSGKTTTLNMIAGFTDVSLGQIEIDGVKVNHIPAYRRNLGVVFQNYALFPHMTAWDNIAYPLRRRGLPKAEQEQRIRYVVELVRLKGLETRYPSELSGGQQQRVALARALVFQPGALLLDEPLGALDKNLRDSLQAELKRIHRATGSTFIFVTHDQNEALALSDRIAIFNGGKVEQIGTAAELYGSPSTLFVAQFLGESVRFPVERTSGDSSARSVKYDGNVLKVNTVRGDEGILLVRPENVTIHDRNVEITSSRNFVDCEVSDVVFQGSHWRYELSLIHGGLAYVTTAGKTNLYNPGDSVRISWNIEDGILF